MTQGQLKHVISYLVGLARGPVGGDLSDRELLRQFAVGQDQEAFAALVRRHGPLVLGVCRRLLRQEQDAEDVFQAVFGLLARKADSPFWHESIGNWLYGVAYRLALRARSQASVRRRHEEQAATMNGTTTAEASQGAELRPLLDEELQRLPEKYRMPLLLCYLHGQSREDAARQLGWSVGAVKGRLERGRDLLRERLVRRGLAVSAALLPGVLGREALAAVPETLIRSTTQAVVAGDLSGPAVALLQGAIQAMFWTKVKAACIGLLTVAVLGTAGWCVLHSAQAETTVLAPNTVEPKPTPPQDAEPAKPSDGKLEAKMTLAKKEFAPGDAVVVQFTVKNVSKKMHGLWSRSCSWGHGVYSLEVTDPAGQRWLLHEPLREWRRNVPSAKDVKPGEDFSVDLDLTQLAGKAVPRKEAVADPTQAPLAQNEWKTPLAPGAYRIRGVYAAKNEFKGDPTWARLAHLWEGRLITEALQITVKPADAAAPKPVEKDGLALTVLPPAAPFRANDPVVFSFHFRNVSERTYKLYNATGDFGWSFHIENLATRAVWTASPGKGFQSAEPREVDLQAQGVLETQVQLGGQTELNFSDGEFSHRTLPPGKYRMTASVRLRNPWDSGNRAGAWLGEINTRPVEFEIAASQPTARPIEPARPDGLAVPVDPAGAGAAKINAILYEVHVRVDFTRPEGYPIHELHIPSLDLAVNGGVSELAVGLQVFRPTKERYTGAEVKKLKEVALSAKEAAKIRAVFQGLEELKELMRSYQPPEKQQ